MPEIAVRPSAVIVDVDGTLTIRRWGGPSPDTYHPEVWDAHARTPYCWGRVGEDLPRPAMVDLVQRLHSTGLAILITSGRSDICRNQTAEWMVWHDVPFTELHMATHAESEAGVPDSDVKRRIWRELITSRWSVVAAFDDRDQVVAVWRDLGIMCAQVGPGAF
jgi:hypothetical protein